MSQINVDKIAEYNSGQKVTFDNDIKLAQNKNITDFENNPIGALVKLKSATASDSSELTFDNFVDQDAYSYYQIVFQHIKAANDSNNLRVKYRTGGASGSDITGTYRQAGAYYYGDEATSSFFTNSSSTDYQTLENNVGNSNAEGLTGKADLFPATGTDSTSAVTAMHSLMSNQDNTDRLRSIHRSTYYEDGATEVTGIKFYMSSGNISSGTIVVYGVKK